jgi:hypothetical protein
MNMIYLGEALLGEGEATRRYDGYLESLAHPSLFQL